MWRIVSVLVLAAVVTVLATTLAFAQEEIRENYGDCVSFAATTDDPFADSPRVLNEGWGPFVPSSKEGREHAAVRAAKGQEHAGSGQSCALLPPPPSDV